MQESLLTCKTCEKLGIREGCWGKAGVREKSSEKWMDCRKNALAELHHFG